MSRPGHGLRTLGTNLRKGLKAAFGHTEGIVAEVELVVLFVPFVEWEVDDPAVGDFAWVFEA